MEYLERMAQESLNDGNSPGFVEASLVREGIAPKAAQEIVIAQSQKVRRAARGRGLRRIAVGLVFLSFAAGLVLGGGLIFAEFGSKLLLRSGLLLLFLAVPLFLRALYNFARGRD
ncbi:MAG: hypothetical protein KY475_18230 [Planctomycetes bacterium]|nr:hypothetical protein [Planctomycetota bacterium]